MVSNAVVQDVVTEVLRAPRRTWAGLGHLVGRDHAVVAERRSGAERRATPERRTPLVPAPRWGEVDLMAAARPHVC